jgi:hypothetical protein
MDWGVSADYDTARGQARPHSPTTNIQSLTKQLMDHVGIRHLLKKVVRDRDSRQYQAPFSRLRTHLCGAGYWESVERFLRDAPVLPTPCCRPLLKMQLCPPCVGAAPNLRKNNCEISGTWPQVFRKSRRHVPGTEFPAFAHIFFFLGLGASDSDQNQKLRPGADRADPCARATVSLAEGRDMPHTPGASVHLVGPSSLSFVPHINRQVNHVD